MISKSPLAILMLSSVSSGPLLAKSSAEIATNTTLFRLWPASVPFPGPETMEDLRVVTQVAVERATADGYHYLHETAIAFHQDRLYLGWANHKTHESNITDEIIRGTVSDDEGLHWAKPEIWAAPPQEDSESFNHPVLFSHRDKLWGFFTSFHGGPDWETSRSRTDIYTLDEGRSLRGQGDVRQRTAEGRLDLPLRRGTQGPPLRELYAGEGRRHALHHSHRRARRRLVPSP